MLLLMCLEYIAFLLLAKAACVVFTSGHQRFHDVQQRERPKDAMGVSTVGAAVAVQCQDRAVLLQDIQRRSCDPAINLGLRHFYAV